MTETLQEFGVRKLDVMCRAFAQDESVVTEMQRIFRDLSASWGKVEVGRPPRVLSDITDEHTPFEFSLAFRGNEVEYRILTEALTDDPRLTARWQGGLDLNRVLQEKYQCSFDRFNEIADLFRPTYPWSRFAMWHAVNTGKKGSSFKIYLNPAARGEIESGVLMNQVLERLGLSGALNSVPMRVGLDELKYFSLDLASTPEARIKVYYSHRNISVADLERWVALADSSQLGEATAFCKLLSGGVETYENLPLQTCLAFTGGYSKPKHVTLHFPIRSYVPNDQVAAERIAECLDQQYRAPYIKMVKDYAGIDLSQSRNCQTYASFRNEGASRSVTVYLSPRAYLDV